ncbi:MAG: phosphotransacetylase family protein [Deltaproteobacteria bacterium]|nr:phosphotransacetylase family protein [Deltaproteobacteria bacterium]
MISVYIGSTSEYSGKGMIAIGLGLKMQAQGLKIGYIKPFAKSLEIHVESIKEVLSLKEPIESMCPVILTHDLFMQAMNDKVKSLEEKASSAFEKISKGKDAVLIGGAGNLADGSMLGISGIKITKLFKAKVLLVERYKDSSTIDDILSAKDYFGKNLKGIILNFVPANGIDYVQKTIVPFLKNKGIDVFGIFPEEPILNSISVDEAREALNGDIICAKEKTNELIERLSIGAMDVDSAMRYFRKMPNKAVITGAHRTDIHLAALETSTRCLILTGGQMPNNIIIGRAENAGIPIMIVKDDTLSTVEKIERAIAMLHLSGKNKIEKARQMFEERFEYDLFMKKLK